MAKHLIYDDRLEIERYLKSNYSLSAISRNIGRHKSTLSNEILLRSAFEKKVCYGRNYNACILRYDCDLSGFAIKEYAKLKAKISTSTVDFVIIAMITVNFSKRKLVKNSSLHQMYVMAVIAETAVSLRNVSIKPRPHNWTMKNYWLIPGLVFLFRLKKSKG